MCIRDRFSRDDLERIVFYELSTRLLLYIAQSVISDDRLRRALKLGQDLAGIATVKLEIKVMIPGDVVLYLNVSLDFVGEN